MFLEFFDIFFIGNDEQKVKFFNKLEENNETLLNLFIEKQAGIIDDYNEILDFLNHLTDK
jgi:hypothetical protein